MITTADRLNLTVIDTPSIASEQSFSLVAAGQDHALYLGLCNASAERVQGSLYKYSLQSSAWQLLNDYPLTASTDHTTDVATNSIGHLAGRCQLVSASVDGAVWLIAQFMGSSNQRLLLSQDGQTFSDWAAKNLDNALLKHCVYHQGYLYAILENQRTRHTRLAKLALDQWQLGHWHYLSMPVDIHEEHACITSLVSNGKELYATFRGKKGGFTLWQWRSSVEAWQEICGRGLYRYSLNAQVTYMVTFQGDIYLVAEPMLNHQRVLGGFELIRLYSNGDWDLLAGSPRSTPHGLRVPLLCRGPGFGQPNSNSACLAVHNGRLYLGFQSLEGFQLWNSADGNHWERIVIPQLSQYYQLTCLEMASTDFGLTMACNVQTTPGMGDYQLILFS